MSSASRTHEEDALVAKVVADLTQPAHVETVSRGASDNVSAHRLLVAHSEMVGDALHVGFADERLIAAATLRASGRAGNVIGHVAEVFARELDDSADRFDKDWIVVVFVDPFAMRDFVRIVITRGRFIELERDVLFVDFDSVDMFERPSVE